MNLAIRTALASVVLASAASAHAACVYPQAPQTFPNGATATKDQMLAAQAQIKEYANSVQNVYLGCLAKEKEAGIAALDPSDPEYAGKKLALESIEAKKHNAAIDELTAVAQRWNDEKKAFENAHKQ